MANLIRLKQIESGSALTNAANIGVDISGSIINVVSASLSGALSIIATDIEVGIVSSSIAATDTLISSSILTLSSSVSTSLSLLSSSVQTVTGDFSASVANTFATQSSNITSVSSSLNAFTSSIGLTIKQKLNTENVITSSHQLDNSVINNLTIGSTGDNYSLIVSGALAIVDADITISGSQYNVAGEIWLNGQTGSAGNPPAQPYTPTGQVQADIIDQGEF
jgi:hypothetical protein